MRRLVLALLVALLVASPAAASPQPLADETAAWLSQTLGTDVPAPEVLEVPVDVKRGWAAASVIAGDGTGPLVLAEGWLVGDWARPLRADWAPVSGHFLLHEILHLHRAAHLEEGAVDAVALDLLAAWSRRFLPAHSFAGAYGLPIENALYPAEVRTVRALSAAATGTRWRSSPARHWRRAFVIAGELERRAMVADANAAAGGA